MSSEYPAAPSARVALAGVAERVVARMAGVALTGGDGGVWQTVDHGRGIRGVTTVAQPDGRFELTVHVVVAWPPEPLPKLADDLRRRIHAAAKLALLDGSLGAIDVDIVSLYEPEPAAGDRP
ncbi:MAG TPA: hypothetical protein VFW09_05255 [Solirubrobacteraceae bacterium]|nr:hypothetical protein [Solirubrobacteraceae bacterium]